MSYIIGSRCISVCDTSCAKVCPVDCINGPITIDGMGTEVENMTKEQLIGNQLFINPDLCIDCGACLPECPVDAIFPTEKDAISEGEFEYVKKNYEFYGLTYNSKL